MGPIDSCVEACGPVFSHCCSIHMHSAEQCILCWKCMLHWRTGRTNCTIYHCKTKAQRISKTMESMDYAPGWSDFPCLCKYNVLQAKSLPDNIVNDIF